VQACTSKGSSLNLTPALHLQQPITAMDNTGGGPANNCGEQGCPDPTPTP
jgi:hypothetical protein